MCFAGTCALPRDVLLQDVRKYTQWGFFEARKRNLSTPIVDKQNSSDPHYHYCRRHRLWPEG